MERVSFSLKTLDTWEGCIWSARKINAIDTIYFTNVQFLFSCLPCVLEKGLEWGHKLFSPSEGDHIPD